MLLRFFLYFYYSRTNRFQPGEPREWTKFQEAVSAMTVEFRAVRRSNFPYPWHEDKLPRTQAAGAASSSSFHPNVARSPEVVVQEVPPPREIDTWGDTICVELLRESPLVVCKVEMSTARGRQSTVMLHCFASEEPTQWAVVILAAPKELLMEKGHANVAVCKRHGETRPESKKQISGSYLVITECLHPSSRMASFLWNKITSECFNPSLQHFAQEVLGRMDLDVWQNEVMKQGLQDLEDKFAVRPGQKGFFARPTRKNETLTFVERQEQGHLPFELDKNKEGKRQRRKDKLPDGVSDHNVHSVMQELRWKPLVFAFMLFPLFFDFRFEFLDIWLMILIEVFDT